MMKRGFTIVELLVVIAIMAVLMVVGVVTVSSSQAKNRDLERKSDAEAIAVNLESFYNTGDGSMVGEYPSTTELIGHETKYLHDLDTKLLIAPGRQTSSLVGATSNTEPNMGVDYYVYQPLQSSGALCDSSTQVCNKFKLYYTLENSHSLQAIMSNHQ